MEKYVCIHGHFYQPPRENPWLESVELQDSAAPYHDWNERICAECYAPNATARILNHEGKIQEIISNYSRISFNFGPTLLAWMQDKMPEVHDAIVKADMLSRERFSGHGSAVAQVYNHMILPLANDRDKYTQVLWGIRDFEHRFGRAPEGMWLAETAADLKTLDTLAQLGIKYTILSPFQASRARGIGRRNVRDVNGGQINPKRPYTVRLPSKRKISVFFYDAPVSQAVAFERLLEDGQRFANRILGAFNDRPVDQLVHIATDGESYGHHHKHGEMALAYALNLIESENRAKLTNYGEYLEKHPPSHEAVIHEGSAWSCVHGVGRWERDCGCNSGGHGGWNQAWRGPLRDALNWLRDTLAPLFEQKASEHLKDPWHARNEYISVILDRSPESLDRYFNAHAKGPLSEEQRIIVLKLMELQRHAMLMFTSCGWFFDELSGIETVQVIQYAARAIQLAEEVLGANLEPEFLNWLEQAKSNIPDHGDGRRIYEKFVRPAMVDRSKAMAHYAISSVFKTYEKRQRVFSYWFEEENRQFFTAGKAQLLVGRSRVLSEITHSHESFSYAILYLGEHNLTGGVKPVAEGNHFDEALEQVKTVFEQADFPETIRRIDQFFGRASYSLKDMFKDEQRRILDEILATTREDLEYRFRLITERYTPLMRFLESTGAPLPQAFEMVQDYVLQGQIRAQLRMEQPELDHLRHLFRDASRRGEKIFEADLKYLAADCIGRQIDKLHANPENSDALRYISTLAGEILPPLHVGMNLWKAQNRYWEMLQAVAPTLRKRAENKDRLAAEWINEFYNLGTKLGFAVPPPVEVPREEPVAAAA